MQNAYGVLTSTQETGSKGGKHWLKWMWHDAVKLCDQLSKDIDPSSRAAAHRMLAETVYKSGLCSTPFISNLEIEAYHSIHMRFEFRVYLLHLVKGACLSVLRWPRLWATTLCHSLCCSGIGQNGGAKIASRPAAGSHQMLIKRLQLRGLGTAFHCVYAGILKS